MKFKSKTALAEHIKELVKSGYLLPEWKIEYIGTDADPMTHATKLFKVNFNKIKSPISKSVVGKST